MSLRVVFVCIHNSARSQMAEAWFNHLALPAYHAESAGIEAGQLNPLVIQAMQEVGIDLSQKTTQTVDAVITAGNCFDYAITVCDETSAERCPIFPAKTQRIHWNFPDPSRFTGTDAEKLQQIREIRDAIKRQVQAFIATGLKSVSA
ncbi:arsenate reductase ArsC [Beggiatoa leptomitoformis]|uniref:Arsenate reductase ArsC n=1 Tax=Beggiatoa leptomitoformis TaxID=288004 RepID=A0A2N9YCH3_9GAMM|nr:arsenate reductase ArsC [Beggiatoa leptomitoformis]ALG66567.1 arsenate reductase ArsC [Beggiatoa leptomitoformis]AUI68134.1 arsenate reductase ArsC [Beggiatoa leptomitoformis]